MRDWLTGVQNWRTTALGVIVAVLTYWQTVGPHLPTNEHEWFAFVTSTALAAFGVLAKDATTGSRP